MNKKIILSLGATALLATSLLAFSPQGGMKQGKQVDCQQGKMMQGQNQKNGFKFMKMFMSLDLSDEQRTKIRTIVKNTRENMSNPHDAFTDSSFDKKVFIKLANEKRDGKIERKADMIEKIYTVLNSSQKKELRVLLDRKARMQKNMMKGGVCDGKNCNGRR